VTLRTRPCPCGSGAPYGACCEPLHDGAPAATAEALMRSRYAAYATGRLDHVFRTWHPRTRPAEVEPVPGLTWTGLRVLATVDGGREDTAGRVEFEARYRTADGAHVLHEDSRFERRAGRWVYVDGGVGQAILSG
jgi:SEC-C motif-containing protein